MASRAIKQIVCDAEGRVFGLGDDYAMYQWDRNTADWILAGAEPVNIGIVDNPGPAGQSINV